MKPKCYPCAAFFPDHVVNLKYENLSLVIILKLCFESNIFPEIYSYRSSINIIFFMLRNEYNYRDNSHKKLPFYTPLLRPPTPQFTEILYELMGYTEGPGGSL